MWSRETVLQLIDQFFVRKPEIDDGGAHVGGVLRVQPIRKPW